MINLCHPNLPNLCSKHPKIELVLSEADSDPETIHQSPNPQISSLYSRISVEQFQAD